MINYRGLLFSLVIFFGSALDLMGQGINKNIWIFGDCTPGRTILNFDPLDNKANVIALDPTSIGGKQPLGENTIATAIDQTSGKLLFYTNGALFFNGNHEVGTDPILDGDETIPQSVAIAVGSFDQDPLVTDNYFVFYTHKGTNDLGFQQIAYDETLGVRKVGGPNNTFKSNIGSAIELVDEAKPNINNTSFLFYYDIAGGNLHALHVNGVTPSLWLDVSVSLLPLGGVPVSIRFNEASNQVAVVTSTGEVAFVKFDRASRSFDPPTSIIRTSLPLSTSGPPKGITFDPTGTKAYISYDNKLFQLDLSSPSPTPPVLITTIIGAKEIFDIQVAPNGKVYFLYTPTGSTEVKLGEIETPTLPVADPGFKVNGDPFPSVNFCGKMFPNFSTTVYIMPTVDIVLPIIPASGQFCADNPIQLVSKITPSNLVPVSYEWKIPASTSPSSAPAPNLSVAHLILAGQGSITVDLTVKFKDHPDITAPSQTVNFSTTPVPEVELNPDPFEVVCPCKDPKTPKPSAGEGVDLSSWLLIGSNPAPAVGYEYFWSAFPERGWTTSPEAKVCEPGLYYVMVREVGKTCYGMAEVLLEVVDNKTGDGLDPGRNGKWFFGEEAGLDFNTFPLFPSNVTKRAPRPLNVSALGNLAPPITIQIKHPQTIEYGVDVFYDVAGNVIFYSDGEKVWDFGHAPIQIDPTGALTTLGGDKSSSQSTLIIPYPNPSQPTARSLFYIFTSEVNAPYQVKFSMLDLAQGSSSTSTAGNYLGTVASSNHLLLPSATQQLAGFTEPNNSFVAVKEMGSGRYRVYKIDRDGIHAPKFSESGTFTPSDQVISGAMQFSRDGKYLASVYSYLEGGTPKSTVEVFSFDKTNGNLSLYASFDLSGRGYGIEVSEDEKRLFVSMGNSIREFFIEAQPLSIGVPIPGTNFNTCFAANSSVLGRSLCIKNSSSIRRSGDFRALQRGPAPADFIFAAVENRNFVAQIDERTRLTSRSRVIFPFIQMSPSGKVLKGLPRYNVPIPKSSGLDSPALIGKSEMCLIVTPPARPPVTGSVVYELSIAGEDLDVHTFRFEREFEGKVTKENVTTFQDPSNPTEWKITFTKPGLYTIYVTVQRCDFTFDELSKKVDIYTPPFILPATINFCDVPVPASPLEIKALNDAFYTMADFEIEWRRANPITLIPFGPVISTDNKLVLTNPAGIGQYVVTAKHKFRTDPCPSSTSVFIGPPRGLDLGIVNPTLCFDETLIAFPYLPPSPPSVSSGEKGTFRIYRKIGIRVPVFELSNSDRLTLPVKNKLAAGDYELEFEVLDTLALSSSGPNAPKCLLFLTEDFTILPEPKIDFVVTNSTSCASPTGEILLRNVDLSFNITINGLPLASFSPASDLAAKEEKISGLSVGSYLVVVENSGCDFTTNILVRNASQKVKIPEFSFEVEPARCNTPLTKGQLTINFPTGFSGNYQIVNPFSTPSTVISRNVLPISKKAVELLDAGNYKLDFFDADNCFLTSFTFEVINEIGSPTSITQYFCPISNPNPELNFPSYLNLSDPSITGIAWRDSTGLLLLTPPAGTPFKAPSKGKYSLEVSYGTCTMTFNFDLLERCSIQYTLPNTIQLSNAPEGRIGTNFQDNVLTLVTSNFVKNVQTLVYNRWGQLIHVKEYNSQTAEASFNEVIWDGKVEGQFVPIGTYVVVLFLTDLNDVVEKTTNSVLVLR